MGVFSSILNGELFEINHKSNLLLFNSIVKPIRGCGMVFSGRWAMMNRFECMDAQESYYNITK